MVQLLIAPKQNYMKLLCVNDKNILRTVNDRKVLSLGLGLVEGDVYTTRGKQFVDVDNDLCYYIEGLGVKLACRFTELLEDEVKKEEKKEFLLTPNLN